MEWGAILVIFMDLGAGWKVKDSRRRGRGVRTAQEHGERERQMMEDIWGRLDYYPSLVLVKPPGLITRNSIWISPTWQMHGLGMGSFPRTSDNHVHVKCEVHAVYILWSRYVHVHVHVMSMCSTRHLMLIVEKGEIDRCRSNCELSCDARSPE